MEKIIQDIILGIIQGLTEFIPVSSSGHLVIFQNLFSGSSDHMFLEFINIGTTVALLVFFRKRIVQIFNDVFKYKNYRLLVNILLTSIPAGVVGYLLADFINTQPFFGSIITVMVTLLVVGSLMIILDYLPKLSPVKNGEKLPWWRAFLIGLAQMVALIPGVSRSGSTIIAGRLMGLNSKEAAEYSFLASLPIMLAVTLNLFIHADGRQYFIDNIGMVIFGNIAAFIAGFLAIEFLLKYLEKHGLAIFGWYRLVLAAIIAIVLLLQ